MGVLESIAERTIESTAWEDRARFLFPFNLQEESKYIFVTTLAAYFDESFEERCFTVAGYLANYSTWLHLDWEWRDLLAKWKIRYFKASECEYLIGEFLKYRSVPNGPTAPMTDADKNIARRAKTEFVDVVCKFKSDLCGIGTVLIQKDFDRLIGENKKALRIFGDKPYYICLQLSLAGMAKELVQDNDSFAGKHYIKPIFDSSQEYEGRVKALYDSFKKKNPSSEAIFLPLDYESDIDTPALQVSDLLAYEVRKHLLGQHFDNRKPRVALERIQDTIYLIHKLDYDGLMLILDKQRPEDF